MSIPQPNPSPSVVTPQDLKQALPLNEFEEVLKTLMKTFRKNFTAFDTKFSSLTQKEKEKPAWEGALSWVEIQKQLSLNENITKTTLSEDVCLGKLREVAQKEAAKVTSHDLRKVLLVASTTNVAANTTDVASKFSSVEPYAALSYRWAVTLGEIQKGLQGACEKDALVWVDIFFNPQNFKELNAQEVVNITMRQYASDSRKDHFLLIPQAEPEDGKNPIDTLMGRGWIALEMAARMASTLPLVKVLDQNKQAAKWYLENRHLTGDTAPDFFNKMETWNKRDKAVIQKAVIGKFGSAHVFNRTVLNAFLSIGAKQLVTEAHPQDDSKAFVTDCKEVVKMLYRQGKYQDCVAVAERQLSAAVGVYGKEHLEVARCQIELADALSPLSRLDEAMTLAQASLAMRRKLLGDGDHVDIAKCLHTIGILLELENDFDAAVVKMNEALEMRKRVLGPNDILVADSYLTIGNVQYRSCELKEVLTSFELAKKIKTGHYGKGHIEVANINENIGLVHLSVGKAKKALPLISSALASKKTHLGHQNPQVALSLRNLGLVHLDLGDLNKALEFAEQALAMDIQANGNENLDVAKTYRILSRIHGDLNNFKEAADCCTEELRIKTSVYGSNHPETSEVKEWMATTQNKSKAAEGACQGDATRHSFVERLGGFLRRK